MARKTDMAKKTGSILIALVMAFTVFFVMPDNAKAAVTTGASTQHFANVVIFVYFNDMNPVDVQEEIDSKGATVLEYYDGEQGQSFKNYMKTISYGQFEVHNYFPQVNNGVIEPIKIESVSLNDARGDNSVDSQILDYVSKNAPGVSGENLDYNGDGRIDNFTVVALGDMTGLNAFSGGTMAAAHSSSDSTGYTYSGKTILNYNLLPWKQVTGNRSGVIAHEFLHTLGYSDLYRRDVDNPDNDNPVGCWDIMAGISYPQWPLAYNRMQFTKWIKIETIKKSGSLILNLQSNKDGNQAFILESPLSSEEVFVVEFRKKAELYISNVRNEDDLDIGVDEQGVYKAGLGGSGLIVYRINKSVEALSNFHGSTGEYVFRPQGSPDKVEEAYLSAESSRTSIGSSNMSDGLEAGALTYTDGSNSGIVISDVSSSAGDKMTCNVSIPDAEQLDVWVDANFPEILPLGQEKTKVSTIAEYNNTPYVMAYNGSVLQTYSYEGSSWIKVGTGISVGSDIADFEQFSINGDLYCAYADCISKILYVRKLNNSTWTSPNTISGVHNGEFDIEVQDNKAVFAYLSDVVTDFSNSSSKIKIVDYFARGFGEPEIVNTQSPNKMYGQPKIRFLDGEIYVSGRGADDNIDVYKKSNNAFSLISDGRITGNGYEILSFNGKLYIAAGSNDAVAMHEYDPTSEIHKWEHGGNNSIANFSPVMLGSNGDIYYVAASAHDTGRITVNKYIDSTHPEGTRMTFETEGESVDGNSDELSMISIGEELYLSYTLNSSKKIKVKIKTQANPTINGHYYHEWGSPTVDTKATFTSEGRMISSCQEEGCNKTKTITIPAASSVNLSKTDFTYNGSRQKPGAIVKNSNGDNVANICTTSGGVSVGTYSARVTLSDENYQNSSTDLYYRINPKGTSIKSPKRYTKAFTARWSRQSSKMPKARITGYQVRYSTKSNMSSRKYKTVKGYKKTSVKIKKLAKKKRYYLQVRTYMKTGGHTYYSYWSRVKSVVTK